MHQCAALNCISQFRHLEAVLFRYLFTQIRAKTATVINTPTTPINKQMGFGYQQTKTYTQHQGKKPYVQGMFILFYSV